MKQQKIILTLILAGQLIFGIAQRKITASHQLSNINTVSKAERFIKIYPKSEGKLFTINSGKDTNELILPLYQSATGFTFLIGNYSYTIVSVDSLLSHRVSYIYINGEKFTKDEIDSIRNEIIEKYNSGSYFIGLASQYNMDGNQTGDTGWFIGKVMVPEFESAVKSHRKNEIFTADSPEKKWYFVVLKTFDDTYIKKLTLLRTKRSH